jgi:hypothetical protein
VKIDFGAYATEGVRDVLKEAVIKQSGDTLFILLGIENQSNVHYAMPIRNGLYDFIDYISQVGEIAKEHKKRKDLRDDEFLSGFSKYDKIKPVITLVVYFGTEEWDGPRSLYDMFAVKNEQILKYVSDYKLNLVIPCEINDFEKFETDIKYVFEFLQAGRDKEKIQRLMEEKYDIFSNMPEETARVLQVCADVKYVKKEEETVSMCQGLKDWAEEERQEGMKEGHSLSIKVIKELKQGSSVEAVAEKLNISVDEVEEIREAMGE